MEHEPDGHVTPPARRQEPGEPEPEGPEPGPPSREPAPVPPASEPAPDAGLPPEEEPTTTGTLFIMILFLMALAGMWGIMYLTLLSR